MSSYGQITFFIIIMIIIKVMIGWVGLGAFGVGLAAGKEGWSRWGGEISNAWHCLLRAESLCHTAKFVFGGVHRCHHCFQWNRPYVKHAAWAVGTIILYIAGSGKNWAPLLETHPIIHFSNMANERICFHASWIQQNHVLGKDPVRKWTSLHERSVHNTATLRRNVCITLIP